MIMIIIIIMIITIIVVYYCFVLFVMNMTIMNTTNYCLAIVLGHIWQFDSYRSIAMTSSSVLNI